MKINEAICIYKNVQAPEPNWKAWSMLWANEGDGKHGEVSFRQISPVNPVLVNINATGLPKGKHAVHIHAFGDMREGCKSIGPHVRGILVRFTSHDIATTNIHRVQPPKMEN